MPQHRYNDLASFFRQKFGGRVQKITLDAGLTCPNRDGTLGVGGCIYCNERGSGTGQAALTITEQIARAKPAIRARYKSCRFIAYFQSFTNTYAPVEQLRALYEEAIADPDIVGLTIGTRPDCVSDDVLDLLASLNRRVWVSIEYGLQSAHDRTLSLINRGHDAAAFYDAVARTRARGIDVTVHVILGLPGESRADMLDTARAVGALDIQGIKPHLLYVVRGTALHRMYERGEYRCLERDEYVDILCDFLGWMPPGAAVHRLTGDPHPEELVAPLWALEKNETIRLIRGRMEEKDVWQGKWRGHNNA